MLTMEDHLPVKKCNKKTLILISQIIVWQTVCQITLINGLNCKETTTHALLAPVGPTHSVHNKWVFVIENGEWAEKALKVTERNKIFSTVQSWVGFDHQPRSLWITTLPTSSMEILDRNTLMTWEIINYKQNIRGIIKIVSTVSLSHQKETQLKIYWPRVLYEMAYLLLAHHCHMHSMQNMDAARPQLHSDDS